MKYKVTANEIDPSDLEYLCEKMKSLPQRYEVLWDVEDKQVFIEFNKQPTELVLNFIRNKFNWKVEAV